MKNKYYTPNIEEFHVGFEFEISLKSHAMAILDTSNSSMEQITPYVKGWEKTKVFFDKSYGLKNKLFRSIEQLKEILEYGGIRVKYLDEEDIEELGFERDSENSFNFENEKVWIDLDFFTDKIGWYLTIDEEESQFGFAGYVKNKSELKKLLKQLNVI